MGQTVDTTKEEFPVLTPSILCAVLYPWCVAGSLGGSMVAHYFQCCLGGDFWLSHTLEAWEPNNVSLSSITVDDNFFLLYMHRISTDLN